MAVLSRCTCRPAIKAHLRRNCWTCDDSKPPLENAQLLNILTEEFRSATLTHRKHGKTIEWKWSDWFVLITTILIKEIWSLHIECLSHLVRHGLHLFSADFYLFCDPNTTVQSTSGDYQQFSASFRAISDRLSPESPPYSWKTDEAYMKV